MKINTHQRVTDVLIAQLEAGTIPWSKPWTESGSSGRPLRSCGTPYQGINTVLLWGQSLANGFTSPYWLTFRQAKKEGGSVRKGEHGSIVTFSKTVDREKRDDATGETIRDSFRILKAYVVFNADQCESLPERYTVPPPVARPLDERLADAERFIASTGARIRHGGDKAYYSPVLDYIQVPAFESFESREAYYATVLHELAHWTGNENRLNRIDVDEYAREELTAELASAFLCSDLGISAEPRREHAGYLQHWIRVLKADNRIITRAAAAAQRAVNFLHSLQPSTQQIAA